MVNSVLFVLLAMAFTRRAPQLALPLVLFLSLQGWSLFSYVGGFGQTARQDDWGHQQYFTLELALPYFVAATLCGLDKSWKGILLNAVLGLFILSGLVAIYEFLKLPGSAVFFRFYYAANVKDGEFGGELIRSSGLTHSALVLGFQMNIALAICAAKVYLNGPKVKYIVIVGVCSLALLASQARTNFPIAGLSYLAIGIFTATRSREAAITVVLAVSALLAVSVVAFRHRLGYLLDQQNTLDSLTTRQIEWQHNVSAAMPYWLTGLGPDSQMLAGAAGGGGNLGLMFAENVYVLYFCMFGIFGLVLFVLSLLSAILMSGIRLLDRNLPRAVRAGGLLMVLAILTLVTNGWTNNLVFEDLIIQSVMILSAIFVYTAKPPVSLGSARVRSPIGTRLVPVGKRMR
jgi:hypothetical protein